MTRKKKKTKKSGKNSTGLKASAAKSKKVIKKSQARTNSQVIAPAEKKPVIILAKRKLQQTEKLETIKPIIKVSDSPARKSVHLINLKNPNSDFFEPKIKGSLKTGVPVQTIIKPPKIVPGKINKIKVDFTSQNRVLPELSLFKLFQPIIWLIKKIFYLIKQWLNKTKIITKKNTESLKEEKEIEIEDIFAPPADFNLGGIAIPKDWYKSVGIFLIISLILVLPFQAFSYFQELQETKDKVLSLTNEAINNLREAQNAALSFDLLGANFQFTEAKQNFSLAQRQANQINFLTAEILKTIPGGNNTVSAGLTLLAGGEILAESGQILSSAGNDFLAGQSSDYYQSLIDLRDKLELGINKFREAKALIRNVDVLDLPKENQTTFKEVLDALPTIEQGLNDLFTLNSTLLKILGEKQWQRYLVIFANNNELRGSGGFMGSFALVDIDRGQIKKMEIPGGGTYDLQGALLPKVISPAPLHLINPRWEFQDANWWPDFPMTAKKIQWFYQNAGGPSTEGVILMTATLMERLLDIVGPIAMPDYNRTIDSKNFTAETQKIVELEYNKEENRPKQFIADLAPKLLERLFTLQGDDLKKLLGVLQQGLNEKHLLFYFNEPQIENIILSLDWGGKLKETDGDFLSVVHTNLAGGKTDEVITEKIFHEAEVLADGSIINTVRLVRSHQGIAGENIFTGVQNNSYVRFYVPVESTLLEASGFTKPAEKYFSSPGAELKPDLDLISLETERSTDERTNMDIYKESGKTVFGNWLSLKPGETKEAVIKYRLPFKLASEGQNTFYYSLLAQKQSGSKNSDLFSRLKLNDQLKPMAKFPAILKEENNTIEFSANLNTDQFYGTVLVNK